VAVAKGAWGRVDPPWGIEALELAPPARSGLLDQPRCGLTVQDQPRRSQAVLGHTHASRGRKEEKSGKRWDC